jgi:hypothetical protein
MGENNLNNLLTEEEMGMEEEMLMDEKKLMAEEEKSLDLAEAPTTEGHREELVTLSDIILVDKMTKDQLQEYAITRLSTDLNLSERVKLLQTKVILMIRERLKIKKEPESATTVTNNNSGPVKAIGNQPEFIFNPKHRRVLEWTETLGARIDYIPCWPVDVKGNRL